jgi:glycosyltransferase involved in cell wall biosynthesis
MSVELGNSAEKPSVLRVAIEQHFVSVDGAVYTDIAFDSAYWCEYLDLFEEVQPVARVAVATSVPSGWVRADGPRVRFHRIREYRGFWQFLCCWPFVLRDCKRAMAEPGPVLLRMGNISLFCWLYLILHRRPYAFEIVGHAGMGVRTVRNVQAFGLARALAWILHKLCRLQARHAACASYVSQYVRKLYPTRVGQEWVFSSVRLPESAFGEPRSADRFRHSPLRIISVGRLEPEKGHDVLVRAMGRLQGRSGPDLTLCLVGPGRQDGSLRRLATELGIADRVELAGRVAPGTPLVALLDGADLFVLPSLTEGMPRALIEGMARGLPAIGSRAGGIMELLPDDCLVAPGDVQALADCLAEVVGSAERLSTLSTRSVRMAREYHQEIMTERKHAFWQAIRDASMAVPCRA